MLPSLDGRQDTREGRPSAEQPAFARDLGKVSSSAPVGEVKHQKKVRKRRKQDMTVQKHGRQLVAEVVVCSHLTTEEMPHITFIFCIAAKTW